MWFTDCKTKDDIRKRYLKLAKKHHPDLGGDNETMKQINLAYSAAMKGQYEPRSSHRNPWSSSNPFEGTSDAFREAAFQMVILALILMPGIRVEVCGSWIWVSGETKAVKEHLMKLGLRFAPKKRMWFWTDEPLGKKHSGLSMEEIRKKYGSRIYKDETIINNS